MGQSVAGCLLIMASIRLLLALLLVACLLALLVDARRKPPKKPSRPGKKPSKPAKKPAKPAKPGRPAKPGKPGKPGGSKPKPKPTAIFDKYTKKKEGGLCWWDTTRKDCAICKSNTQPPAVQCGFPMHNYCYKKGEGCPWVKTHPNKPNVMSKYRAFEKYTLSTTGYPCYWNHRDFSCAWCTPGAYQCGPSNRPGSICSAAPAAFNKVCDGNKFGCDQIPTCHVDATCTFMPREKGKFCVCNEGFTGNGIQCVNKATGTTAVAPETTVDITASFTRNLVTDNNGQFPEQDELLDAIKSVNNLCKGAFASCAAELNVTDSG